ncbi:class I SAM-dependent methyltransferase [Desulfosudis oleivorans]|uniref:class I SAM-dependent methyltransferase n=1 Tax=Desulfosudis oleivorans TaxID=181663 RepID=UPI00030BC956|nr:methyltransferase domain-containing protein [Desulfosudis oleivorans]
MKSILTELLICPVCLPGEHGLKLKSDETVADDIIRGDLTCDCCGRSFPIRDGLADLDPGREARSRTASKYETPLVLSSYLWSHFAGILKDSQASGAYVEWAGLMASHDGLALDVGSAVGRFAFEMAQKCDFVIGLDNSVTFIRTARELMQQRRKRLCLPDEGHLTLDMDLVLPETWRTSNMEFIVADAQALPFRCNQFASVASLNMVDKLPRPLAHLQESNRVAKDHDARFLLSDPFSWSGEVAAEENWLGGLGKGPFAGHGLENTMTLLADEKGLLGPRWTIEQQGHVWWKIRTHSNHFELIRSRYVKAVR